MASKMEFVSRTQHYLKVKKPLLERQRRARVNKCLDALKILVAELQGDDAVLRLDKAELLESTINFLRAPSTEAARTPLAPTTMSPKPTLNSFCNGYMNAVGEVSRVMASTHGMDVNVGKAVMVRLGLEFNRLLKSNSASEIAQPQQLMQAVSLMAAITAPMSPASSGYLSDYSQSPISTPEPQVGINSPLITTIWRPW